MYLKIKGTITLNNDQVCTMLDFKDQVVDKMECQCDSHQPCFPHSREKKYFFVVLFLYFPICFKDNKLMEIYYYEKFNFYIYWQC